MAPASSAAQVARAGKRRKNNDALVRVAVAHLSREGQAGQARHFYVGHKNVGLLLPDCFKGLMSVGGAGADSDVGLSLKQRNESAENHGLIFRDDDLDFGVHGCP